MAIITSKRRRSRNISCGGNGGGISSPTTNNTNSVYNRTKLILLYLFTTSSTTNTSYAQQTIIPPPSQLLRGNKGNKSQQNHHQRKLTKVQNYCGTTWSNANNSCLKPCPDGNSDICPGDEKCWADLTSCPSMEILTPQEVGMLPQQPASLTTTSEGGGRTDGKFNLANGFANDYSYTNTGGGDYSIAVEQQPQQVTTTSQSQQTSSTTTLLPFQTNIQIPSHCPLTTTNIVNIGYYQSWSKYRPSTCNPIPPSDLSSTIQQFGYTHLIYSFASISSEGLIQPYNGVQDEIIMYNEFNSIKTNVNTASLSNGQSIKTLIAIGGWNMDQSLFTKVASTSGSRLKFANSIVDFITLYNFDGVDLDWEYPVTRQGSVQDYTNYVLLCESIRSALDEATISSGRSKNDEYLLTMAIPINPQKLQQGYNLRELSKYIHWFHLMSYDINGAWNELTGSNTDMEYIINTIDNSILNNGIDASQLVFGLASYGRSMILQNPTECNTSGCPIDNEATNSNVAGCSGEVGFIPLFEIQETYVQTQNYNSLLLNEQSGSMEMIVNDNIWISFDLKESYMIKRDWYLSKCFRGQMWWAIDMIKDSPWVDTPIISTSMVNPQVSNPSSSVTQDSQVATSQGQGQLAPGVIQDDNFCSHTKGSELAPTTDCLGFVHCSNGIMTGSITLCSPGLVFDANMGICNWPSKTNVCGFEFCPNEHTGYVPFEECSKFYYCSYGKIDGDIDVCPEGTLFDHVSGICNWKSAVTCDWKWETAAPTPMPTPPLIVEQTALAVASPSVVSNTPPPTYGKVQVSSYSSKPQVAAAASTYQDDSNVARLHFTPTDDTYVQEDEPNINFQSCIDIDAHLCDPRFIVVDANKRFDGLLRFYVQGLEGRRIEYVKLRLYVREGSTFGGNFFVSKADWHEDVVTWSTVPSIIGNEPLAVVNHAVQANEWVEVDVTNLVTTDGPVSIRITSDSDNNVMYSSKENTDGNSPELIVGMEPKSIVLPAAEGRSEDIPPVTNIARLGPSDDAFVFHTMLHTNYGRHEELKVDMDNGDKKLYLRFDLSRVHIDAVKSAKLRLYATDSSPSGGSVVTVSDSNWKEDTITYDTAPPADGMALGMFATNVQAGQWYELDITKAITESGPLTICIMGNHDDRVMYSSKEGQFSPEIELTLQEVVPLSSQSSKVVELIPTDDAMISPQDPDKNFGSSDTLQTSDNEHDFLIRFDASDIPRGQVKQAELKIYAMNEERAFGGTFVETRRTEWDESTITYTNAPDADGKVLGSIMEAEAGSYYTLDVTPAVVGGSAVSFRVSSPHFNKAIYGSKNSNHQPRLVVQYSPADTIPDDMDVYIPTDDASVLMNTPNKNFGRAGELKIDGSRGIFHSLLRFDLTELEKGTVVNAKLRLYALDGSPSGGTIVVTQSNTWSQHKVTWNTAPSADGRIVATIGEVAPYQWYEIDLADIVNELGGEILSIRITPSHGNRCAYASSRDRLGHQPQLLVKSELFAGVHK